LYPITVAGQLPLSNALLGGIPSVLTHITGKI